MHIFSLFWQSETKWRLEVLFKWQGGCSVVLIQFKASCLVFWLTELSIMGRVELRHALFRFKLWTAAALSSHWTWLVANSVHWNLRCLFLFTFRTIVRAAGSSWLFGRGCWEWKGRGLMLRGVRKAQLPIGQHLSAETQRGKKGRVSGCGVRMERRRTGVTRLDPQVRNRSRTGRRNHQVAAFPVHVRHWSTRSMCEPRFLLPDEHEALKHMSGYLKMWPTSKTIHFFESKHWLC